MIIKRAIQSELEKSLFKGKAIVVYGSRQSGKTTLIKEIQKKYPNSVYYNCEERDVNRALTNKTSTELKSYLGGSKLVFFDEAQKVLNIGVTLKLIVDTFPDVQVVATGSSSFDLSNKVNEPLTGRKYEYYLYPLSFAEIFKSGKSLEIDRTLEERIIYGMYPEVVLGNKDKVLNEITKSYLYKDALQFQDIKNPEILERLLEALALQIGNEVSFNELARLIEINKDTVQKYVRLLEQAFIIFRLRPLTRNPRVELRKLRKIYFWDTGIRNSLINNLNPLSIRQDVGALWENFLISERLKTNSNLGRSCNYYFWRTHQKQEIDFLEDAGGKFNAFEIKWGTKSYKIPKVFTKMYPDSKTLVVNRDNYKKFISYLISYL